VPQTKPIVPPLPPEKGTSAGKKSDSKKDPENQLAKNVKDSTKIAMEAQHGLIAQVIKDILFSSRPGQAPSQSIASVEETVDMAIG